MALALNERGQVAGWSQTSSGAKHLFLWEKGRMRDLGMAVDEYAPVVMNNRGQIAAFGLASRSGFVWEGGTVRVLKAPRGAEGTRPADINEAGQIVGISAHRAFLWHNGRLRFLPTLPGAQGMDLFEVNEQGQIISITWLHSGYSRAVEWDADGRLVDLGATSTAARISSARAINECGQVVGSIGLPPRAALWWNGKLTQLRPLRRGDDYRPLAINRSGLILGFSYPDGLGQPENARAVVWKGTKVQNLGTLVPNCYDACDTTPSALNDAGQVIGVTQLGSGVNHGFVWRAGHMIDLGAFPGAGAPSSATALNGHNQIIGTSTIGGRRHAVIWSLKP